MTVRELLDLYKEDGYNDYVVTIFKLRFDKRTCQQYHERMNVSFYNVLDECVVHDRVLKAETYGLPCDEIQITIGG